MTLRLSSSFTSPIVECFPQFPATASPDSIVVQLDNGRAAAAIRQSRTTGVLHLINGEHFSGAERVQQHLGHQLIQFGFTSHFACLKPGKFAELSGLPAERVHPLPMRSRIDWDVIHRVTSLARETDCSLLHAHTPRTALVAAFAAHRLSLPWVYHIHSPPLATVHAGWSIASTIWWNASPSLRAV